MSEPTTLATPVSFEEKMMARIKESMGDLMTDDQLKGILEKGVEKAFFERRTIPAQGLYGSSTQKPSLVDQVLTRFLETRMKESVEQWIKDHPELMEAAIQRMIDEGIVTAIGKTLGRIFEGSFEQMVDGLRFQLGQLQQR